MEKTKIPINSKFKAGDKFNKLTLISVFKFEGEKGIPRCTARCECGAVKEYGLKDATHGKTKSCGCIRRTGRRKRVQKPRVLPFPKEYRAWQKMKERCRSPKHRAFKWYGGRGIQVCSEWANSFATFLADMGTAPSPKHSVDRIDNDKGYSKANCRWANSKEQNWNRRDTVKRDFYGATISVAEAAHRYGKNYDLVTGRIERGWSLRDALFISHKGDRKREAEFLDYCDANF